MTTNNRSVEENAMARRTPTYYAVSTLNSAMLGWSIYAIGDTRDDALAVAEQAIGPNHSSIEADTLHKNLRVWSKTAAQKVVGRARLEQMEDDYGASEAYAVACGRAWAEREYEAADDYDADGHSLLDRASKTWNAIVNDSLPLIDEDLPRWRRYQLAEIANDAAGIRWAELIEDHKCEACAEPADKS